MLSSMIVSRDWQEVSVFECILASLQIAVAVEEEPKHAWDKLATSKVDALIVDRDLSGADGFLERLRRSSYSPSPVVILSGSPGRNSKGTEAATFVMDKPVSVEHAVHTLSAARNLILRGRLHYHRQTIQADVALSNASGEHMAGRLLNLSQGGALVHLNEARPVEGTFQLGFTLPGTKRSIETRGSVIWSDAQGNAGLQFVDFNEATKRDLQLWLERQYFQP
jgi:PilZ domain